MCCVRDYIPSYKEIQEYLLVDCDGFAQSLEVRLHAQTRALRHGDLAAAFVAPTTVEKKRLHLLHKKS